MNQKRTVLIVDESEETRAVLRAALSQHGAEVLEAVRPEEGLELAQRHRPGVIVLDTDHEAVSRPEIRRAFKAQSDRSSAPLVLLGAGRKLRGQFPGGQYVNKPYHYAPLIRRIEHLLERTEPSGRAA